MLGMCFDKRVLGGLALMGIGVLVFAPSLFAAALPLLIVAICPLSMLFMGRAMMGGTRQQTDTSMVSGPAASPIDVPYRVESAADPSAETAALRQELQQLREQQAALTREIARLESPAAIAAGDMATSFDRSVTR